MFRALKPGLSKLVFSYSEYMVKRTATASRGFLAAARTAFLFIFNSDNYRKARYSSSNQVQNTSLLRQFADTIKTKTRHTYAHV